MVKWSHALKSLKSTPWNQTIEESWIPCILEGLASMSLSCPVTSYPWQSLKSPEFPNLVGNQGNPRRNPRAGTACCPLTASYQHSLNLRSSSCQSVLASEAILWICTVVESEVQLKSQLAQAVGDGKQLVAALNWLPGCRPLHQRPLDVLYEVGRDQDKKWDWMNLVRMLSKHHVMPKSSKFLFCCLRSKQLKAGQPAR